MSADEAQKEKELGNAAYKKKDFGTAHAHYDKAIALDPTNIAYLTNKAAAFYEEKKYQECVDTSLKAVEIGRENRADYKLIAKALKRAGIAYEQLDKLAEAVTYLDKSLSEHRDSDTLSKRNAVAKKQKEAERLAYIDPAKAAEEKTVGNTAFKAGDFPTAIRHYSEAIKRDPDNAVLYSNRAACYTKLMEFPRALSDCDTCIQKDPKFIKGYIRKGAVLTAMKESSRAAKAYEEALAIDANNQEAQAGYRQATMVNMSNPEEARKKAMNDPEIQGILGDPAMRLILEQMSRDPKSAQEHLKNPDIRSKLTKLMEAGIVEMR